MYKLLQNEEYDPWRSKLLTSEYDIWREVIMEKSGYCLTWRSSVREASEVHKDPKSLGVSEYDIWGQATYDVTAYVETVN